MFGHLNLNQTPKRLEKISNHIRNAKSCRMQLQGLIQRIDDESIDISKQELIQVFNSTIDKINKKDCEGALEEIHVFLKRNCFEK